MLLDLLPEFSQRGWHLELMTAGTGALPRSAQELGYTTHSFPEYHYSKVKKSRLDILRYSREWPVVVRHLYDMVRTRGLNTLYANGPRVVPAAAFVARLCGVPLIFHCHSRLQQLAAIRLVGNCLRLSKAQVIGCCRYAVSPLLPYLSPDRVCVLYNGVARSVALQSKPIRPIQRVGVVGRIEEEKGQLEFVRAARILAANNVNLEFFVIGAPLFSDAKYMRTVKSEAEGLPVQFVGWQKDIAKVFSGLDLVVVPSTHLDSTPRVIIEALAFEVPVVAFGVGGIPEVIQDGSTGFLVHTRTPEALADTIKAVLGLGHSQLAAVVDQGLQSYRNRFELGQYRRKVGDLIEQTRKAA